MNSIEEDQASRTLTYITECNCDISWVTRTLAVGSCFAATSAPELAFHHQIKALVDLRGEGNPDEALRRYGIEVLHLPTTDMHAATQPMLDTGVRFVRERLERGERVLIHCHHGIGRAPLLALCVLVDLGFEPIAALSHLKDRREQASPSEDQYRGWAEWLRRHGREVPDYHSFGCIAYRHLASG